VTPKEAIAYLRTYYGGETKSKHCTAIRLVVDEIDRLKAELAAEKDANELLRLKITEYETCYGGCGVTLPGMIEAADMDGRTTADVAKEKP